MNIQSLLDQIDLPSSKVFLFKDRLPCKDDIGKVVYIDSNSHPGPHIILCFITYDCSRGHVYNKYDDSGHLVLVIKDEISLGYDDIQEFQNNPSNDALNTLFNRYNSLYQFYSHRIKVPREIPKVLL